MRYRLQLIPFFALSLLGYGAQAQNHPNLEKGFAADKMYQFGDIDHVNLFNGNVALTIPIGGSLPVSDHLSLSLTLIYNSKLWQAQETRKIIADELNVFSKYTPERTSNSGFGWTVSLGRLIDPSEVDVNKQATSFLYQAPDGSESAFYPTVHRSSSEPLLPGVSNPAYSRDNTYLRLMQAGAHWTLESPDGTTREFESYTDTYTRWRLIQIRDRAGNHIDIDYSTPQQWRITDQHTHLTIVHFGSHPDVDGPYQNSISSIEVQKQGGGTASYVFDYGTDQFVATGVCGQQDVDPDTPAAFKVPLLRSLTLPDNTSYSFTYTGPIANSIAELNTVDDRCHAGEIASVTLPTTGKITYAYQEYELPTTGCPADSLAQSSGVSTRLVQDPLHTGNDQKWQYGLSLVTPVGEPDILCPPGGQHTPAPPTRAVNTVTVTTGQVNGTGGVIEQKTHYHFSVWGVKNRTASDGTTARDFGLPFVRQLPSFGSRFLSTEVMDSADNPLRQTYVNYQYDFGPTADQFDSNRRLTGSRTVYWDDDEVTANSLHKHYIDNDASNYDGVGHYRVSTTSGDLVGAPRTVTTAYNTADPTVNANALSTGTYDSSSSGGTFVAPSAAAPWVLNLYPTTTVQEGSGTAVQEFCFDPANGFLKGTRTRGTAFRASSDLVTAFGFGTSGDVASALISEKYYGGDFTPLTVPSSTSLCDSLADPGPLGYDIRHTYSHGVRSTSEYFLNGSTVGFKFLDRDIDLATGLVTHSRDSAGVDTTYVYDSSRRLQTSRTGSDAQIGYVYTNPAGSSGAAVTISQSSITSGNPQVAFQYDGFGRLTLQSHTLPSTIAGVTRWTKQSTQYDAMGRKSSVSESEEANFPSHLTTFTGYDRFGRVGTITRPDGSLTTFLYHGVRETERTSRIRTQTGTDTLATTKEFYDLHGRLSQVREPGDNTVTDYTYDVGGRLHTSSSAGAGTTQLRTFTYDNRGFLLSETHPELGQNGNGTTFYEDYDARGHARRKLTGSASGTYDLRFTYDESERLTFVRDNGGSRELKHFLYGTSNDPQLGKLSQAIRTNHLAAGDVTVTETYHYESSSGRPSDRQTDVTSGSVTLQSYKQLFSYDDLGSITRPGYPYDCIAVSCAGVNGLTGAAYEYKEGLLSKIPGYASNITYSGNGMVSTVEHENLVTDTITPDASGMSRPASIAITGWTTSCSPPAAPVITASTQVCASSANNSASVPSNGNVQFQWSISGGQITSSTTGNAITYTAGSTSPVILSVTASNNCGTSPAGTRNVTVAALPTATVSGSGPLQSGSRQIQAALTGTGSWSVTWSDGVTLQSSSSPQFRTVTAAGNYSVTSVSDANCTNNTSNGSSAVVTANSLPAPAGLIATTQDANTRMVHLLWAPVQESTGYRIEQTTCLSCGWSTRANVTGVNTYDDTVNASAVPVAYLYRVIATASGSTDSPPSPIDYATTATILFAEPIGSNGVTPIRGSHTQELRRAIDALRLSAGLQPYMPPLYSDGWADYSAPTGIISATHVAAMRAALDDAVFHLFGVHMSFNGEAPTSGHGIFAFQYNQLRTGVK